MLQSHLCPALPAQAFSHLYLQSFSIQKTKKEKRGDTLPATSFPFLSSVKKKKPKNSAPKESKLNEEINFPHLKFEIIFS